MKEYIEKDLVMDALLHEQYGYCCEDAINDIPAADVAEVRHAELLDAHPCGCCSLCGFLIDIRDKFNYCPNCGAAMHEVEE